MEILLYENLDFSRVEKQFEKTVNYLKADDFYSADVKKMPNTGGYYRARLDDTNRLLFKIGEFEGKKYIFLLEVILNHDYDKSRFLNGAEVDEGKLIRMKDANALPSEDIVTLGFVNKKLPTFHILDKILSFDDSQGEVLHLPTPLIVIGSAGSGKTALALEKIKTLKGKVLYITLSPFLVEHARQLYTSFGYENTAQEVEFLTFTDFLSIIELPKGKEIDFRAFDQWISRYKQGYKIRDSYKLFEEFKGVLTGSVVEKAYLSKEEYFNLGIKQSIFSAEEKEIVYELFVKYLDFLKDISTSLNDSYYDSNIVAFEYLRRVEKKYDFVVIDEVQDITNVQLYLIINGLKQVSNFILCGDANQIVHPNFFSWSQLKSLFYKQDLTSNIIRVLVANYRNTPEVTEIANQLLRIKNARFGSIDRESTYLVESRSQHKGEVAFLENVPKNNAELNEKTNRSTQFAVLVMRNEDKAEARKYFDTPLLFSIQEAKGLEYENIILFNVISSYEKEFKELTNGVEASHLVGDLDYSRGKDKADRSLDAYKFYVNSLYVAMTRAIKNLYVIETNNRHSLLTLLGFLEFNQHLNVKNQVSSHDDWQKEARRLELQGKQEQADAIRNTVLKIEPVPWEVVNKKDLDSLVAEALNPASFNKKAKDQLFERALFSNATPIFKQLSDLKYRPADRAEEALKELKYKWFSEYMKDDVDLLLPKLQKYGVEYRNPFNLTPLMCAVQYSSINIMDYLFEQGVNINLSDELGMNTLRMILSEGYKYDFRLATREKAPAIQKDCRKLLAQVADVLKPGKYRLTPEQRAENRAYEKIFRQQLAIANEMLAWIPTETERDYKRKILGRFYPVLKKESLMLKLGNSIYKIDSHQGEYFLFQMMFAAFRLRLHIMTTGEADRSKMLDFTYHAETFEELYKGIPEHVLPIYQRSKDYISIILSRHEMFNDSDSSKKLFMRIEEGYMFNPLLEMEVEDKWENVYDLLAIYNLAITYGLRGGYFFPLIIYMRQVFADSSEKKVSGKEYLEVFKHFISSMMEGKQDAFIEKVFGQKMGPDRYKG